MQIAILCCLRNPDREESQHVWYTQTLPMLLFKTQDFVSLRDNTLHFLLDTDGLHWSLSWYIRDMFWGGIEF